MIAADLRSEYSEGFGSLAIHRRLLLEQLEQLQQQEPALRADPNFVRTYIKRLQPGPEVNWQHEPQQRRAYLDRLWQYVEPLPAAMASLKVHVRYHQLVDDRQRGQYDRERLLSYLALPRSGQYVKRAPSRAHFVGATLRSGRQDGAAIPARPIRLASARFGAR